MDEQIEHAVARFLSWKLPHDFIPDGGILFYPSWNKDRPTGTNLFTEKQAREMFKHCLSE